MKQNDGRNKDKKKTRLEYPLEDGTVIGSPWVDETWERARLRQAIAEIEHEKGKGEDTLRDGYPGG